MSEYVLGVLSGFISGMGVMAIVILALTQGMPGDQRDQRRAKR